MKTFWNTRFTKRDPECTNIVAIKGDRLPKGYDPEMWKDDNREAPRGMMHLGTIHANGERFEQWGYL